jgi:hypothetical protein
MTKAKLERVVWYLQDLAATIHRSDCAHFSREPSKRGCEWGRPHAEAEVTELRELAEDVAAMAKKAKT